MNNKIIKIGGKNYKITIEEDLTSKLDVPKDQEVYGCIDYVKSVIRIDNNMSNDSIQEALVHEILHAIIDRRNIELINKNSTIPEMVEHFVEYLTPRFHAFFIDNPNFQKDLLKINSK